VVSREGQVGPNRAESENVIMMTRAQAALLLFGGAAIAGTTLRSAAATNTEIRIAIPPVDNAAEVYYAQDMGFFAKSDLAADISQMQNGSAIAAAITGGAMDIGYITGDALGIIHQRNVPIVVIAPGAEYVTPTSTRTYALVVPANSPVRQAKDLNGKIIATPALNGLSQTAPRMWLDQNGGDSSTIKFTEVPYPAMPAAIASARVDAAFITEPFIAAAMKNGRVLAYGLDAIAKNFLIAAWCATPQWAKDHPDVVDRFAVAIHESAVWANANQAKSGQILAKYTKLDPSVAATMMRVRYAEKLAIAQMQPLIDASAKYNHFTPFPAQELAYSRGA
jgi:NitT/TauT family transport system substrate-binding protein